MSKLIFPGFALMLLAACSGAPTIASSDVSSTYQSSELAASAAKTPVGVSVLGRPFGLDDQAAAAQLIPLLPTATPAGGLLRVAAAPTERPIHRLVFDFAAPENETAEELCRGGRAISRPTNGGGRATVFGALCIGETPLSWAVGSTDLADSLAAPAFRRLMERMGSTLMPTGAPGIEPCCS